MHRNSQVHNLHIRIKRWSRQQIHDDRIVPHANNQFAAQRSADHCLETTHLLKSNTRFTIATSKYGKRVRHQRTTSATSTKPRGTTPAISILYSNSNRLYNILRSDLFHMSLLDHIHLTNIQLNS